MSRANLLEMPAVSIEDGDPFTEQLLHPDLEKLFDYHLHLDVDGASDETVDRLGDMWPIHRDRWLGQCGLIAAESSERRRDHLVVYDSCQNAVARIPAGLAPSTERVWLKSHPSLSAELQTVDERFDENMALFFEPVSPNQTTEAKQPQPGRLARLAATMVAFVVKKF